MERTEPARRLRATAAGVTPLAVLAGAAIRIRRWRTAAVPVAPAEVARGLVLAGRWVMETTRPGAALGDAARQGPAEQQQAE
jgi:hypothetical protein